MTYFTRDDHTDLAAFKPGTAAQLAVYQKLLDLNKALYPLLRNANIALFTGNPIIDEDSVCVVEGRQVLSIAYRRSNTEAITVERLMGREEVASTETIEVHRHPTIEVRLTPQHLTVELVMSPDAWWDQRNFVGKLSIARQRTEFFKLMRQLDQTFRLGFWQGTHLGEMHLNAKQFHHIDILNEWINTFEAGKDWFRLGAWYEPDAVLLDKASIHSELLNRIKQLYPLYQYLLWTGDNNFQEFYEVPSAKS